MPTRATTGNSFNNFCFYYSQQKNGFTKISRHTTISSLTTMDTSRQRPFFALTDYIDYCFNLFTKYFSLWPLTVRPLCRGLTACVKQKSRFGIHIFNDKEQIYCTESSLTVLASIASKWAAQGHKNVPKVPRKQLAKLCCSPVLPQSHSPTEPPAMQARIVWLYVGCSRHSESGGVQKEVKSLLSLLY